MCIRDRDNGALIKKIYVPKYIFTLSKVTSSLIDLIFSMGALILVMLITRAPFSPYILLFPLVVIPLLSLIHIFIFICVLLIQIIFMIFYCDMKKGYFVDELWSYGLSNSYYHAQIWEDGALDNPEISPDMFKE